MSFRMKKRQGMLLAALVVLVVILVQMVYAAGTTVDTFDVDQYVSDASGTPTCDGVSGASIWGTYRDVEVQLTSGAGTEFFEVAAGYGSHNNPIGGQGTTLIQWDGDDDSASCPLAAPTTSNLNADFTTGGATRLVVEKADQDRAGGSIRVRVYESGGGSGDFAEYTWSGLTAGQQTLTALFTDFAENGNWSNSTDWQNVAAVTMYVVGNVNALDMSFDFLGTDTPTAIDLASFTAAPAGRSIQLQWETATELDNLGFNVYRAEAADGPWTKLNASLIPAQAPGSPVGAAYAFEDADIARGATYYYRLEDLDVYGQSQFHGPVSATSLLFQRTLIRPRLDAGLTRK